MKIFQNLSIFVVFIRSTQSDDVEIAGYSQTIKHQKSLLSKEGFIYHSYHQKSDYDFDGDSEHSVEHNNKNLCMEPRFRQLTKLEIEQGIKACDVAVPAFGNHCNLIREPKEISGSIFNLRWQQIPSSIDPSFFALKLVKSNNCPGYALRRVAKQKGRNKYMVTFGFLEENIEPPNNFLWKYENDTLFSSDGLYAIGHRMIEKSWGNFGKIRLFKVERRLITTVGR